MREKSYEYIESLLPVENQQMKQSRSAAETVGLNQISLSATEGQLLKFMMSLVRPKKIVEIGTLTGLSANYFLSALPKDGKIWTLEKSEKHAQFAEAAISDNRCRVILGDALENLPTLNQEGPFDIIFIDGNKAAYLKYFDWALVNVKKGGLIIADNVFLAGAVWGAMTTQKFNEKQVEAVRTMNKKAFTESDLISVIVPTTEGMLISHKI